MLRVASAVAAGRATQAGGGAGSGVGSGVDVGVDADVDVDVDVDVARAGASTSVGARADAGTGTGVGFDDGNGVGLDHGDGHRGAGAAMLSGRRSLKARALRWLAGREHSRTELRRKLLPHAVAEAEGGAEAAAADDPAARVEALLDWLESHRYLSAERFVESRIHARQARFGNLRIRREIEQHGLALPLAAASALRASERARAAAACARRFGDTPGDDPVARARRARFLAGRGFSFEVIAKVVRGGGDTDASD